MSVSETERAEFAALIGKRFAFLWSEGGLLLTSVRSVDEGPRDSNVVATYRSGACRVDVGWAPVEMSLSIRVRLERDVLSRRERYIYAEPFIAFITQDKVAPIVPQVYPGMSVSSLQRTMDARVTLFAGGLSGVVETLAIRLRTFFPEIRDASADAVRAYHRWYRDRGAGT